jgi:2-phospho-L-lactate guanylyltransferase
VIPVKRLASAHSRLATWVSAADRARLSDAMLHDLLAKIRRCKTIHEVIIVTADASVARSARWIGHRVLMQRDDAGHSQAAAVGARAALARGFGRVAMLPIDCPLLDPRELDSHLGRTPRAALIVPDRHGTGTNALVLSPPDAFAPAFGPGSCARHASRARAAGISFSLEPIESLATDLDTPEDLTKLRDALIVDPRPATRTAQVLWDLEAEPGSGEARSAAA